MVSSQNERDFAFVTLWIGKWTGVYACSNSFVTEWWG